VTDQPNLDVGVDASVGTHIHLRVLDTNCSVEVRSPEAADQLRKDWSRCLVQAPDADVPSILATDSTLPLSPEIRYRLVATLTERAIAALAGRVLMLHAAGLADDEGRVTAVVASSGAGKTTLARTLCRTHFGYVTDETVAISDGFDVLPYPKPLSVIPTGGAPDATKEQFGPDVLGLRPCPKRLAIHRIVLLDRRPGIVTPHLTPLGYADALVELIPQTSAFLQLDRPLVRLCELLDHCGGAYRLSYSDASQAAGPLAEPGKAGDQRAASWAPLSSPVAATSVTRGCYRSAPITDGVEVAGGEAILMARSRPVRLGPVGLTIWKRAAVPASFEDLLNAAVSEHGVHPAAPTMVADAVRTMVAAGVLCGPGPTV